MCTTLPNCSMTVMGIEKVVPSFRDLEVMLSAAAALVHRRAHEPVHLDLDRWPSRPTARAPSTSCSSTTGRTRALADEVGRDALRCIRCSACINVCPVYRQTGGHAYHTPYAGPIGPILQPQLDAGARRLVLASVRLDPLRRLRGRLSGADRHPGAPRARAREGGQCGEGGAGDSGHEAARTCFPLVLSGYERAQRLAHLLPEAVRARRLDTALPAPAAARPRAQPRSARRAAADLPGAVGVR